MRHFLNGPNVGMVTNREQKFGKYVSIFVSNKIIDAHLVDNISYFFPLYLYPEFSSELRLFPTGKHERIPNLNNLIIKKISENINLKFINEKEKNKNTFAPIDVFDYIYAVLHSTLYREKYNEFLKIDFPRIPYPSDKKIFWQLVEAGAELRSLHLLENPKLDKFITEYPKLGDNIITRTIGKNDFEIINEKKQIGRLWINDNQYFDKIPIIAWNFYIGGYQPAQKWLKDRKGMELSKNDIFHYQKIITSLYETNILANEIDKIFINN